MTFRRAMFVTLPVATWPFMFDAFDHIDATWISIAVFVLWGIGEIAVGLHVGWRAIPIFAVGSFVAAVLYQLAFWHDDPTLSGIDDFSPTSAWFFALPFVIVPLAIGVLAKYVASIPRISQGLLRGRREIEPR